MRKAVKKYPDLTRGISKKITKRRHISSQMYKKAVSEMLDFDSQPASLFDFTEISAEKEPVLL